MSSSTTITTEGMDYISNSSDPSASSFMTNPNYRIIAPQTPSASSSISISSNSNSNNISNAIKRKSFGSTDDVMQIDGAEGRNTTNRQQQQQQQQLRTEYDVLPYEIHSWSSHSSKFLPHNILVEQPHLQESRWSTNFNNHLQFIMLKLEKPALVSKYR